MAWRVPVTHIFPQRAPPDALMVMWVLWVLSEALAAACNPSASLSCACVVLHAASQAPKCLHCRLLPRLLSHQNDLSAPAHCCQCGLSCSARQDLISLWLAVHLPAG